ncbi:MAG: hypothetical protein ABIE68_02920 [bacterium]
MKNSRGGAMLIIVILVLILLLGLALFWYFYIRADVSSKADVSETKGTITGSLGYPSEAIPTNMMICAVERDTVEEYCTAEQITDDAYTYGKGYSLVVPEGVYYVYSYVPTLDDFGEEVIDYKAYYSDFVTCGQSYECEDHEPIEIVVTAGTIYSEVDPIDWYAPIE